MKKQLVSLASWALLSFSCQSSYSARSSPELEPSSAAMNLWKQYVQSEVGTDSIAEDCKPRLLPADPNVGRQGLLMFFHGFTSCPQEFQAIGERLAQAGFDVYLPLLPGHGRSAAEAGDRSAAYRNFIATMNEVARLAPRGDKVIAGLSGGGALAMEAALAGPGVWDRVLVYAPRAQASLSSASKIQVPLQFVGVRYEASTEAGAVHDILKNVRNARLCFYPEGVPHAMLQPSSADANRDSYWLPALEEDSLAFITRGRWFLKSHVRTEKDGPSTCRYAL